MIALLTPYSSYSRNNQNITLEDKGAIYQILYYASLTGSSHNSQPTKAEVYGEDSILVFADITRKLQVENCGGWIVITQPSECMESWINTGKLYQSMHLKCRK